MTAVVDTAQEDDGTQIGAVVTELKALYKLTDKALASKLGLRNAQDVQSRRSGEIRFQWPEVVRLARVFELPLEVFAMTPEDAVRRAVELGGPWRAGVTSGYPFWTYDRAVAMSGLPA